MTIDKETRAEILRLYHVEKWTVGTITRQLGVHRYTVERLLTAAGEPRDARSPRPSMIDPYVPFIAETLASWPTLPASRLYQMVRERGYRGGDHFRHLLSSRSHRCRALEASRIRRQHQRLYVLRTSARRGRGRSDRPGNPCLPVHRARGPRLPELHRSQAPPRRRPPRTVQAARRLRLGISELPSPCRFEPRSDASAGCAYARQHLLVIDGSDTCPTAPCRCCSTSSPAAASRTPP